MFRLLLKLPDGEPPDPAFLVTAVPMRSVGDVITVGRGEQMRSSRSTLPARGARRARRSRDLHVEPV